ncbi:putative caspase-like protein [Devosia sp. UYZn731]|uniref:caspase family protein n=1 Tax=Devosia sp. UYZn731 TaxID=3156345 RepID=UPI003395E081
MPNILTKLGWVVLSLVVLVMGGTEAAYARQVALVIGNGAYRSVPALPNPENDARAVANSLIDLGFETRVRLNLDQAGMISELQAFAEDAKGADYAAVYYAGHGIELEGVNYLIPVDAVLSRDVDIETEAVPLERVLEATQGATRLQLIMLDACRNNPFLLDIKRTLGENSVGKGLARIEPKGSTLVSFAATAGNTAYDGVGDHSPYTDALLRHLSTPGLEVNYVFRRVNAEVRTLTGDAQQPVYYGTLSDQEIYLSGAPSTDAAPQSSENLVRVAYEHALSVDTTAGYQAFMSEFKDDFYNSLAKERIASIDMVQQERALETAPLDEIYWLTIKDSDKAEDFQAYLRRYPNGSYADLARARITALDRAGQVVQQLVGTGTANEASLRRAATAQLDRIPFNMVQYGLVALGFNVDNINGVFDSPTRKAVRAYQASIDAPQTGRLSDQQTVDLLLAAAAVGDQYAQMTVGVMLADGIFWQKNYSFARMWLTRSANQENPYAMTNLALIYRDGLGTPPDEDRARILLKRAVVLGSDDATTILRGMDLT